jgi:hypothetical protein
VITNIQYQAKMATLLSQKFLMFWSFFFKVYKLPLSQVAYFLNGKILFEKSILPQPTKETQKTLSVYYCTIQFQPIFEFFDYYFHHN